MRHVQPPKAGDQSFTVDEVAKVLGCDATSVEEHAAVVGVRGHFISRRVRVFTRDELLRIIHGIDQLDREYLHLMSKETGGEHVNDEFRN